MDSALAIRLGSLDDSESIAGSDITDGLDSSIEYDFDDDDDCEDNWDNSNGDLDEDGENPDYIVECNAEPLKDFTYEDEGKIYAEGHALRLLRLVGGTGPIRAYLFKAYLHKTGNGLNGMPYEALSYTWGTDKKTKQITLNDGRFLLTENLYSALRYLRFEKECRILWIDAICIDQSHIAERNHQVSHMASIYRDADRVLFWLGEPTYETNRLISSLIRLQTRALETPNINRENVHNLRWKTLWNEENFYEDSPALHRGLVSLLEQSWFKRSWILQEVCFAETGVVTCGSREIAAHIFALTPWLLDLNPEAHCKAVLHMMPGATRSTRAFLSGREMRNFYSLLRRFYRSEATDPRDQVYALLSMATDANMAGFPVVDYGKDLKEVVDSVFAYLFPTSWCQCGGSQNYETLSEFVEDFPRLREAEINAADDDILLKVRLSDDTELTQLHLQDAFRIAVQTGNAQLLQNLLRFPNINLNDSYEFEGQETTSSRFLPSLCVAAACGFTNVVKLLIEDFRLDDINSEDTVHSRTPLSWAAENGHEAVVKLLLTTGKAEVDSKDKSGRTPLSWTAGNGHEAVAKLLLATGRSEVDSKDIYDRTPLSWAAGNGHEAVVKLLLAMGKADADSKDKSSQTPLSWAAKNGHEAVVKLLLAMGKAEVDSKDIFDYTPLSWAAKNGHEAVVKLLLATGNAEVNSKDEFGWTPLSRAAENGYEAVVKLLLATGKAKVDLKDEFGQTSLLRAANNGHEAVVKLLVMDKAEVNLKDELGLTLLSQAAKNGHEATVKLLLATGKAEVDSKDISGQTPLSWAAKNGHEAVVKLLLATGKAEVDLKDISGQTPLSRAAEKGHEAVVKLLLTTGKAEVD